MKKFNVKNAMLMMIFAISVMSFGSFARENNIKQYLMADISTPISAKECKNKQVNIVEGYFKDAGFTDIELSTVINEGIFPKEGKVSEVTIKGNGSFKSGDRFPSDSKVRIIYFIDEYYDDSYAEEETFIPMKIKSNKDLLGTWVQTNASEDVFYYAEIDEDTITVFSCFDEDEITELYWTGTFNSNIDIKKKNEIESENYRFITDGFDYASHADNKIFIYEDGKISYDASYLGVNENVVLEKDSIDWAQTVKLTGNRQEGYNDSTNKKIEIGGLEISYPYYYDSKDETSKDDDMLFYPSDNTAYSNFEVTHTVLDEKIEKEWMLDIAYEALNDPEAKIQVLDQEEIVIDGINGVKTLYSTQDGIGVDGMFFVNNGLEVVLVDISFSYADRSKNNYIKDFESIINNIKQIGKAA